MKQKTLTTIFAVIFLTGILGFVSAGDSAGVLNNISGIYINNFVAGSTTTASFSYNYLDYYGNKEYPHILQINITSENQTDYPVWKGDFELGGFVRKYTWFGLSHEDIGLECHENSPLTINHPLGINILEVLDGTFYCYNATSEAINNLDKHDEVSLTIKSHPALWPGQYQMFANVYYLDDTIEPIVDITNKNYFETHYFKEGKDVEIIATIKDNIGIKDFPFGKIFTDTKNISVPYYTESNGIYYFLRTLPEIAEGNWEMKVYAEDTNENVGNDTTILKIDNTAPEIIVIKPEENKSYDKELPIKLNVSDWKSGVDNSSVRFRIREIKNGTICPETGGGFNYECLNTGWLNTTMTSGNLSSGIYEATLNISEMDEGLFQFWLEVEAYDILGNKGEWIK